MTNAELIQKIRAEIEGRIEHHDSLASNAESEMIANLEIGAAQALDDILPFLSTLESEKPMQEGLEKEIETYFKGWYMDETDQGYILHTPDDHAGLMSVKQVARHFAEWGYLRATEKYNEIEYNRQIAEEHLKK